MIISNYIYAHKYDGVCDDEEIYCLLNQGRVLHFYQSEEGLMYDIYNSDPRDDTDDEVSELLDGGLLECDEEEHTIDVLQLISKLAFILPEYPDKYL